MKFDELLTQVPAAFIKDADVESPDEMQLENDFANMAFAFLQDRAPKLLPFLLGFEVVEREEDGSKAIGIFGFKVGEDYYYVPSFFTNSQVRGMDLLFSKRTNSFVPLRESWINYVLDRQAIALGESAPDPSSLRRDLEQPDFDFLAEPPTHSKRAEAMDTYDIAVDGFDTWNHIQHEIVEAMDKDAGLQEAFACAISRMRHEVLPIEKTAENSPITAFLANTGGPGARDVLMNKIANTPQLANAFLEFYPDLFSAMPEKFAASLAPVEKEAARLEVVTESRSEMSSSDKKRLVRDGFTVLDRRGPGEKSEVFATDYVKTYSNPDRSGTYNVLLRNGMLCGAWVCESVCGMDGMVVIHPQRRFYFSAEPGALLVEGEPSDNGKTPFEAASPLNRMRPGSTYILVNEDGKASAPFSVETIHSTNRRRTHIDVNWKTYIDHKARSNSTSRCSHDPCSMSVDDASCLELASHKGKLSRTGKKLVVPTNWKALQITGEYDYDEDRPEYDTPAYEAYSKRKEKFRAASRAFRPGDHLDLDELLEKQGLHSLIVENEENDSAFHMQLGAFSDGPYNYKSAAVRLAQDYGMDMTAVDAILGEAVLQRKSRRLVKFAQGVGASMPMPPPPSMGFDQYAGVPIEYGQTQEMAGQTVGMPEADYSANATQPMAMGGQTQSEVQPDQQAMDVALQAADAGQKHIFDHATIGGLSRLYDPAAVIDSYMPDLSKALDRVGRVLFIFYWKNEDFSERYGDEDMGEMEDLLRGVFKSFGDLVLKLKQKSVDVETGIGALSASG